MINTRRRFDMSRKSVTLRVVKSNLIFSYLMTKFKNKISHIMLQQSLLKCTSKLVCRARCSVPFPRIGIQLHYCFKCLTFDLQLPFMTNATSNKLKYNKNFALNNVIDC